MANDKSSKAPSEVAPAAGADRMGRIANLMALLLVKGMEQRASIVMLHGAGFEHNEIAALLDTTAQNVAQVLYLTRNKNKARRGRKGK